MIECCARSANPLKIVSDVMLAALLLPCLLDHVTSAADSYTTQYLGCFEVGENEDNPIQGGIQQMYTDASVYSKCESLALSKGYSVFAIYHNEGSTGTTMCLTADDAHKTFADNGESSEECSGVVVNGRYFKRGGGDMSVYQIVAYEQVDLQDSYSSISCEQENPKMEAVIIIVDVTYGSKECAHINVTTTVREHCDNLPDCTLDCRIDCTNDCTLDCDRNEEYPGLYCKDGAPKFTVTYGCVYLHYEGGGSVNIGAIIWWTFFLLVVIVVWCKRGRLLEQYPALRGCCWQLHTECPSLKLYPSGATRPDHGMQQVVMANPSQITVNPAATGAYPPPPSVNPPSGVPPADPPPADTENLPPPPTYDAATTGYSDSGTTRRSGGWFTT